MKQKSFLLQVLFALAFVLFLAVLLPAANQAHAAEATATLDAPDTSAIQPLIDSILGKNGWLVTVISIIGSLRVLFKPFMLVIQKFVKDSADTKDDERLASFERGPIYKGLAFILDFGASIKLPMGSIPRPPARAPEPNL